MSKKTVSATADMQNWEQRVNTELKAAYEWGANWGEIYAHPGKNGKKALSIEDAIEQKELELAEVEKQLRELDKRAIARANLIQKSEAQFSSTKYRHHPPVPAVTPQCHHRRCRDHHHR